MKQTILDPASSMVSSSGLCSGKLISGSRFTAARSGGSIGSWEAAHLRRRRFGRWRCWSGRFWPSLRGRIDVEGLDAAQARDHIEMIERILAESQPRLCSGGEYFVVWGVCFGRSSRCSQTRSVSGALAAPCASGRFPSCWSRARSFRSFAATSCAQSPRVRPSCSASSSTCFG